MAPRVGSTYVAPDFGKNNLGVLSVNPFQDDDESSLERQQAKQLGQPALPVREVPPPAGLSRAALLFANQSQLDANKTSFDKLTLEGGKLSGDDDKVENLVAQALLAFAPIVGGYIAGGDRGAAGGAVAGLIGQKTYQDTRDKTEAKGELKKERERLGLEKEREGLLKTREGLEVGGMEEMEADQNRADNLENQKKVARYSSGLSIGANRQRLRDQTAEYQRRDELGIGRDDNGGYATPEQLAIAARQAREVGNTALAEHFEAAPPHSYRVRDLLNATTQLTKTKNVPNNLIDALGEAVALPEYLGSLKLVERLRDAEAKGLAGTFEKAVPLSDRRALAAELGSLSVVLTVLIQGSRPSIDDVKIEQAMFDDEAIASGRASGRLLAKMAAARSSLRTKLGMYGDDPTLSKSVARGLAAVDQMEASLLGKDQKRQEDSEISDLIELFNTNPAAEGD